MSHYYLTVITSNCHEFKTVFKFYKVLHSFLAVVCDFIIIIFWMVASLNVNRVSVEPKIGYLFLFLKDETIIYTNIPVKHFT